MNIQYIRALRTPSSERFILQQNGKDVAAVDLHYLANAHVAGTVTVFADAGLSEAQAPELLARIDEDLLPEVSVQERNLIFTVVIGKVLGSFEPDGADAGTAGRGDAGK